MEKKKRRSSQVFHFEQTEEALEENEALRDLYQNKNFILPDPKELETIVEEGGEKEDQRARRGGALVAEDGGLVVGKGKGKRSIEGYKYWKQDDKERNKKRKSMLAKQWKGRKKPKLVILDWDAEQKLQFMIDTREESEDEEEESKRLEDCSDRLRGEEIESIRSQIVCVWGKGKEGSGSSLEDGEGCVWSSRPDQSPSGSVFPEAEPPPEPCASARGRTGAGKPGKVTGKTGKKGVGGDNPSVGGRRGRPAKKKGDVADKGEKVVAETVPVVIVTEVPNFVEEVNAGEEVLPMVDVERPVASLDPSERGVGSRDGSVHSVPSRDGSVCGTSQSEVSLATLCSMIPAQELAELLETTDLLFCGAKEVVREETNRKGRESVRRSVRRSARLQQTPLTTGSVFTEEDMLVEERSTDNKQQQEVTNKTSTDMMSNTSTSAVGATLGYSGRGKITLEGDAVMNTVEEEVQDEVFTNEEVVINKPKPLPRDDLLQPPSLASLRISEVTMKGVMTPPPLSKDSKENFFLNNIPRIEVAKKGKTKRRVPELGSKDPPVRTQDPPASPDSVLKDLSNLSLEAKSKPLVTKNNVKKLKSAKTSAMKKNTVNTVSKAEMKTGKLTSKDKVDNVSKMVTKDKMTSVGVTSRRKKKVVVPSPDTTDGGFCFSGNLVAVSEGERKGRRQSLRSGGGRGGGVDYCEESERSGTVSRRGSEEGGKNSSLEGSRRNSVLATSGEREIDISMPASVRRSFTGEFVPRLNLPPAPEPVVEVAADVKPVVSVGEAFWSDSDEEEIISGIFGKKTLQPWKQKQKTKINRGFLN